LGTVPTITAKHDEGHIHHALPICGLPPEGQHDTNKAANKHNDHGPASNGIAKELLIRKGADLIQNTCEIGNQMSLTQSPVIGQTLSVIDPSLPPPLPDAKDGPEAVMFASMMVQLPRLSQDQAAAITAPSSQL